MMAVSAPVPISLTPGASGASIVSKSSYLKSSLFPGMASQAADMSLIPQDNQLSRSSPTHGYAASFEKDRAKTSARELNSSDTERVQTTKQASEPDRRSTSDIRNSLFSPVRSSSLKIDIDRSTVYDPLSIKEDEPPQSVIHAPLGFGNFTRVPSTKPAEVEQLPPVADPNEPATTPTPSEMGTSTLSTLSSESANSAITVTRLVGEDFETVEKPGPIPPLQTQLPMTQEWTKTPRAQTRRDLGVLSRPGSGVASLASISEAEDDHPDHPTDVSADEFSDIDDKPMFYRTDEDEIITLQTALSECWTLCNTLASLSYIHREKIFSRKGNMQQQAWRSCWRLCQNLYETRNEISPLNVRVTLDLCREFCQALFDVRARDNEGADSVLRVSFELNNHLFNTHDRSLPEAFSERTLDFYITLCHRLMKQRSTMMEETGSLLRACWALAEMLFTIRQTRRDARKPDEELLSSAIQACWELCDLFRDGWTQIRPERQTPRPAQSTLTQAFQQAKRVLATAPEGTLAKILPETPTTIFEDINAESPYVEEMKAPNIVVLGPGDSPAPKSATSTRPPSSSDNQLRKSAYKWPSVSSASSVTELSIASPNSLESSIRTVRSPSDDPNMALLKSLFVRAAINTHRGFSPLASTTHNNVGSLTSLPLFAKSLPETAFGSQAWQMSLLDHYRKAIANDATFRVLGIAANPILLGIDGDETTTAKIRVDTARAILTVINGTFGWSWLKDLFRFAFGVYVEDVLGVGEK